MGGLQRGGLERRGLQVLIGAVGSIPIVVGVQGVLQGAAEARRPVEIMLDSSVRFQSVLMIGAGLALYWCIPRVERVTAPLRALCGVLFLAANARLLSLGVATATSNYKMALTVELLCPLAIVLWQARVAATAENMRASSTTNIAETESCARPVDSTSAGGPIGAGRF
jgi:hypothetical protein